MSDQMRELKRKAVALRYKPYVQGVPLVTAKGTGKTAEEIIRLAQEHHVPIQEDESLVNVLSQLDVNEQIPPELYQMVAEILAFVYRVDTRAERDNK